MDRRLFAASVVTAAVGLASLTPMAASAQSGGTTPTQQQMMQVRQANQQRMQAEHLQKCYGVNAVGRNDCAAGVHSCAGQATMANDPQSFVLLPAGDCAKINGGKLAPS
jgi:uncharacterized membrane protein